MKSKKQRRQRVKLKSDEIRSMQVGVHFLPAEFALFESIADKEQRPLATLARMMILKAMQDWSQ